MGIGLTGASDDQLMTRIQAGDQEAFGEIYDRYSTRAYGIARLICGDSGRAEDAVQEAFVSIWRRSSSYEPQRGSLAAWLLSIARHRAIDVARAHATQAKRRGAEEQLASVPAPGNVADRAVEHTQIAHLQLLLARLPEAQREVIVLAFYGQLTHSEIAGHLDLAPGTVKGRIRLGLQKLQSDAQLNESHGC